MKVSLEAMTYSDPDGEALSVSLVRDDVETVEDMAYLFTRFLQAAGYAYVDHIAVHYYDGTVIDWSLE